MPVSFQTNSPVSQPNSIIKLPPSSSGYNLVAVSSGGSYYTATQGGSAGKAVFYVSNPSTTYVTTLTTTWTDLCMSSDGSVQVLVGGGAVYYVTDYAFGSSLSQVSWNTGLYTSQTTYCALNENGNVLVVGQIPSLYGTPAFTLAIYVATSQVFSPLLTPIQSIPVLNGAIVDIALDSTGTVISVVTTTGYLYLSTNQGNTWTNPQSTFTSQPYIPYDISSIAMSSTNYGQYMTIVSTEQNFVYYSSNQGDSFQYTTSGLTQPSYEGYHDVACSSTGQYVVVSTYSYIFMSMDYGVTWTNIMTYSSNTEAYTAIDPIGSIVCYVDGSSSAIALYHVPTVPTPAPTTIRPTVSSAPSHSNSPTHEPTKKPTPLPTPLSLNTGWLYQAFYDETDCTGAMNIVVGYRLDGCFTTKQNASYSYSCQGGK